MMALKDHLNRCSNKNAAKVLGKSESWLNNSRVAGTGPRWWKVDGTVYYDYDELVAYGRGEVQAKAA